MIKHTWSRKTSLILDSFSATGVMMTLREWTILRVGEKKLRLWADESQAKEETPMAVDFKGSKSWVP